MWSFLARNKQVAAMLGLLSVAAIVAICLATKGGGSSSNEDPSDETEDFSNDTHIFSAHM